jgi:hypothetical protein
MGTHPWIDPPNPAPEVLAELTERWHSARPLLLKNEPEL